MKQWRIVIMLVVAVLVVLFIVQLGSISFSKGSPSIKRSNKSELNSKLILHEDARSDDHSTSSPTAFTKTFSRRIHSAKKKRKGTSIHQWKVNKTISGKQTHFCWEEEEIQVIGECIHCSRYEKRVSAVCLITGNKQLVMCVTSKKKVYKSCPHVKWLEERTFWTFEGAALILLIISGISVWHRNKKLDAIFNEKLRKKVANDNL